MKRQEKRPNFLLRCAAAALGVWAAALALALLSAAAPPQVFRAALAAGLLAAAAASAALNRGRLRKLRGRYRAPLRRGCAGACVLALCLSLLPVRAAAVEGTLSVDGVSVSDSGLQEGTKPTDGSGGTGSSVSWSASGASITGTVTPGYTSKTSGGGCGSSQTTTYYYYSGASSTLTLTNSSGEEAILSFEYTAPAAGTLTVDGTDRTSGGSFSKELGAEESVTVTLTTPDSPTSTTDTLSNAAYAASTTLSGVALQTLDAEAGVTLLPVSVGGSYTAKAGSTALTVGETYRYPLSTTYTFTATVDESYVFDGWYVNGAKAADTLTYTRSFTGDSNTVEARFAPDPMLAAATVSTGGSAMDYLAADSAYIHSETGCRHTTTGDSSKNNNYGTNVTFPHRPWSAANGVVGSSWSGVVGGDYQTEMGFSNARAFLYSDVIRLEALQPCTVSFDLSVSARSMDDYAEITTNGVYAYTYVTTNASATTSAITSNGTLAAGGQHVGSGSSTQQIALNEGDYLYIYFYAETLKNSLIFGSGADSDNVTYNATISNFTITPNNTVYTLTAGNRDNTGAVLAAGSVKINGVNQSVASGSYQAEMSGGSALTLTPGTAPSGYAFIGWHNVTTGETVYTSSEYTVTMTQNLEVQALYVPAMTITTGGANGYESATYTYKALSGSTVAASGQYVARNSTCTAFYTTLNEAFAATDTVVLLAGDTISGDLTIPAGKTLVIPHRLAAPGSVEPEQVTSPATMTNYCAVTYTGGALTVDGTLVVSGAQSGNSPMGVSSGGIGYLKMDDSASMTVNGMLSVAGLIRGGSQITVNAGAEVYELMVIADFRALLFTQSLISDKRVFPFNNFYIKNIEDVPVTYQAGAELYARYSMRLQGMSTNTTGNIPVINTSGALFNLTQGTFTKTFDLATDKTIYCLDEGGVASSGNFSLTMTYALAGMEATMTVDTAEYDVPLNAGFVIQVDGDMTVNSNFKFLPGAVLSVGENGTCTIAAGKEVFLYRLNDYDVRTYGSGLNYQGFSSVAYPVAARNYPAGGYSHPNINTVGSARLNVDGEMIVNGGLYVTDMPCEAAFSSGFKDNGYNVLTGTGTIDFTNASTGTAYVEETNQASGSNDPRYVQVTVTPIAGLSAEAVADDPESYQPFTQGSIFYGAYRPLDGGIYVWGNAPFTMTAEILDTDGMVRRYLYLSDALMEYDAGTRAEGAENDAGLPYIQMLADSEEPGFTIDKIVYLDLNGKTVTLTGADGAAGTLTIAAGGALYGMDSSTNDYTDADHGRIVGTVVDNTAGGNGLPTAHETYRMADGSRLRYLTEQAEDGLSFHRYNMSVTKYEFHFRPSGQCDMDFGATFRGSSTVVQLLKDMGFRVEMNGKDPKDEWWSEQYPDRPASQEITNYPDRNEKNPYILRGTLINIGVNQRDEFTKYYDIYALLKFQDGQDGTVVESVPRPMSYLWALKQYYNSDAKDPEKEIIDAFLEKNGLWGDWDSI